MQTQIYTYADIVQHCLDYLGGDAEARNERYARMAIQAAVNDFKSKKHWSIFYKRGRIATSACYQTGTIAYLASSGAIPRQVTLTGGTWPSWAADGLLRIGNVTWPVWNRVSDTVLQLEIATASQIDISSTAYLLTQEKYPLPVDFGSMDKMFVEGYGTLMRYLKPGEFYIQQSLNISPAYPNSYTVQGDPRRLGSLAVFYYPAPDNAYTIDYSYQRLSRALQMHGTSPVVSYQTGLATVASDSTTVTGSGTSWTSDMVGCVMRFAGAANGNVPTGQAGSDPFYSQRMVTGFTSATQLTIDQVTGVALTSVPHSISDPVDLEAPSMLTYFLRECEKQARLVRRLKPEEYEVEEYRRALIDAMEADNRHYENQATFDSGPYPIRISNMPTGIRTG